MLDLNKEFRRPDGTGLEAHRTPFPATFFAFTDESVEGAYVNEDILNAHHLITEELVSPYYAWAKILGYELEDMPSLLNLGEDQCDLLMLHPDRSPPTANVHYFCDKVGVHPALLLPINADSDYQCHYSILRAVAHIYQDTKMNERDRAVAKNCLETERDKFLQLEAIDPYAYRNLMRAHQLMQGAVQRQAVQSMDVADMVKRIGLMEDFSYVTNNPASDIDAGLDIIKAIKTSDLEKSYQCIVHDDHKQLKSLYAPLLDAAELLFGFEVAESVINKTVQKILDFEKNDQSYQWNILPNGNWLADKDGNANEVIIFDKLYQNPMLFIDGEYNHDLINHYERGILSRVCLLQMQNNRKESIINSEKELTRYDEWRNGAVASNWHIPLLANFVLSTRTLGKAKMLPAPEQNEAPVEKRRHAYAHSFK